MIPEPTTKATPVSVGQNPRRSKWPIPFPVAFERHKADDQSGLYQYADAHTHYDGRDLRQSHGLTNEGIAVHPLCPRTTDLTGAITQRQPFGIR